MAKTLEKALRELSEKNKQSKLKSQTSLADANNLLAGIEDKARLVEEKMQQPDAKLAEVDRKSLDLHNRLQDLDTHESVFRVNAKRLLQVESGIGSQCQALGFENAAEYNAIANFFCNNCQLQRHQCFLCGMLGSSNESLAEVYPCVSSTCGYYYHAACLENKLYPGNETMATAFSKQITSGEPLICPIHKCHCCGGVENKNVHSLQFAICRRCPKSYHRECLPRTITFTPTSNGSIHQRAWDNLLPNRILMCCMRHEIQPTLHTPKRDHLLFPYMGSNMKIERTIGHTVLARKSNPFGNAPQHILANSSPTNEASHTTVSNGVHDTSSRCG